MKRFIPYFILLITVYIYFFDPFYFPIGFGAKQFSIVILYIVALVYCISNSTKFRDFHSIFRKDFNYLIILFLFSMLITLMGGNFSQFGNHVKLLFSNFLVPIFILNFSFRIGIDNEDKFAKMLLVVASIAATGTMLCLMSPSICNAYKLSVIALEEDSFLTEGFRGFGFSTRLTSDYGFIQGAMMALGVYYGRQNKWFYVFFFFVFISSLLNARTGVIVAAVGIFLLLLQKNRISYTILVALGAILLVTYIEPLVYGFMEFVGLDAKSINWIGEFFSDVSIITQTKDITSTGIGETLLSDMIFFPENLHQWLFGSGESVFYEGVHSRGHSDVGFIIQLNYGGVFYFTILMLYMLYIIKRIWKSGYKFFAMFFFASFLLLNTKSNFALRQGGILGLYLIIYYFLIYCKESDCAKLKLSQG